MITNADYTIENYRGNGKIIVPKGTRLTNKTACGIDEKYHFVDDLSFMPGNSTTNCAKHDATYYGIDVPKEYVDYSK